MVGEWDVLVREVKQNRARFEARLNRNIKWENGCLLWTGPRKKLNGYGVINFKREGRVVQLLAHRMFLMMQIRRPIVDGMEAGHFDCHNRLCLVHVEEQTRQKNLALRDEEQRAKQTAEDADIPF